VIASITSIPERLAKRRRELKMTQTAIASLAGITQSYLSAIERGKIDARLSTLQDIARALKSEFVFIPNEALSTVKSIIGNQSQSEKQRLFSTELD
jgi:predicted transcriptional regulator